MLAHLRNLSLRTPHALRLCRAAYGGRRISSTSVLFAVKEPDNEGDAIEGVDVDVEESSGRPGSEPYEKWLEKTGITFRDHDRSRNWLGGNRPFPLNPTFKPPTPVSDELRSLIYAHFIANPAANDVRALSERFGLSMKRIDAILRLKGLEDHWIKEKKPLQTGFLKGMEHILGVTDDKRTRHSVTRGMDELGEDATGADYQDEASGNDAARHRYQRMFWEPVVEGQEPVVPGRLENARAHAEKFSQAKEDAKSDPKLLGRHTNVPADHEHVHIVERVNRPTLKFVDVGGKFINVKDRLRRMKESERRVRLREKRRLRKLEWRKSSELTN